MDPRSEVSIQLVMVANNMLRPRGSCVLVTGATGFLGAALAQDLVTQGFRVIGA